MENGRSDTYTEQSTCSWSYLSDCARKASGIYDAVLKGRSCSYGKMPGMGIIG